MATHCYQQVTLQQRCSGFQHIFSLHFSSFCEAHKYIVLKLIMADNNTECQQAELKSPRYDWYQTDSQVVITILVKNLKRENVYIDIEEAKVEAQLTVNDDVLHLLVTLAHNINPVKSCWKLSPSKVEVKLQKCNGVRWATLESKPDPEPSAVLSKPKNVTTENNDTDASHAAHQYPSSSRQKKDWDKIEHEVKKEEEGEELEGDAALNKMFQKIYASGSEETKRAMNKSFSESGGTVLSTNWSEIAAKKTEVKPPEGMEYKQWES